MRAISSAIGAAALSICALPGLANAAPEPVGPTPLTPPDTWVSPADYPTMALVLDITGATSFRLVVDPDGIPVRCEITESSMYDVLDEAACKALMAKARFSPSRDENGEAVEGGFTSRVVWALPPDKNIPSTFAKNQVEIPTFETYSSFFFEIDQTGKATSCHYVRHTSSVDENSVDCERQRETMPAAIGLVFREQSALPVAKVEVRSALTFSPQLRDQILAPATGADQVTLGIWRLKFAGDGTLIDCAITEQRGDMRVWEPYCHFAAGKIFDPPFAAVGKDGTAEGWHILKTLVYAGAAPASPAD